MKRVIFFIAIFFLSFPIVNADALSVNSGGDAQLIINPDTYIEGFFSCVPNNCTDLGYECDTWSDGCGKTINCGSCSSGYTCTSGTCVSSGPTPTPSQGGSTGGGGGGGEAATTQKISVEPTQINLDMVVNTNSFQTITITNLGGPITVTINQQNLDGLVVFSEDSFLLQQGASKQITMTFLAPGEPGIYTGKIIVNNRVVFVALNVKSEKSLFDISIDLSESSKIINPGDKITGQITLIQAGLQEKVDVTMIYLIKDFSGSTLNKETESVMVFKQKIYEHEYDTSDLLSGDYLVGAEVIYSGGVATSSQQFKIRSPDEQTPYFILTGALVFSIIILIFLIILVKKYKKRK